MSANAVGHAESLWRASPKIPGRIVETGNGPLWVRDSGGSRPAVILLHANTGTAESWQYQFGDLVAAGLRVIAFDRPGRGCSPEGKKSASLSQTIDRLTAALGIETFMLVGVAGGSFVAIDYASSHPNRVSALVLLATTGQFAEPEIDAAVKRIEIPDIRKHAASYRELGPSYRAADPEGVAHWMEVHEHAEQEGSRVAPDLSSPNNFAKLRAIACRTLVIAGGADLIAPPALMRMWFRHAPNWQLALVEEAGHAPQWESPETVNRLLTAFLTERG